MANLTLAIDEDVLRRARIRALEQGTSVNALLREYLDAYAGEAPAKAAKPAAPARPASGSPAGAGGDDLKVLQERWDEIVAKVAKMAIARGWTSARTIIGSPPPRPQPVSSWPSRARCTGGCR